MRGLVTLLVVASTALVDCATHPKPRQLGGAAFDMSELVPYRILARDDFRSPVPTGFSVTEEERLAATVCVKIVMRPENVITRAERSTTGEAVYVAAIEAPIFFAVMSRKCSYFSPDTQRAEDDVLEHEQVHFAIAELEARRLNARADDIVARVRAVGSDPRSAHARASSELARILETAAEAFGGRSTVFDGQVFPPDRVRQRQWLHKVEAELEATEAYARGPQMNAFTLAAVVERVPPAPAPAASAPAPPVATAPVAPSPPSVPALPPAPAAPPPSPPSPTSTGSFPD